LTVGCQSGYDEKARKLEIVSRRGPIAGLKEGDRRKTAESSSYISGETR
jgi:hypothetical protein